MAFNLNDYETVESRLEKFWKEYPNGRVETKLEQATDTRYIVSAKLFKTEADAQPCSTGLASESISDRGVNSTSALENAETSAIGRALANAGYAAKGKRPSREEITKVTNYSPQGSRARVVEDVLRASFAADKADTTPQMWSVGEVIDKLPKTEPKPMPCENGYRKLLQGTSKNNKPYYGYVCDCGKPKDQQCQPQWAKLTADGNWYFEGGE